MKYNYGNIEIDIVEKSIDKKIKDEMTRENFESIISKNRGILDSIKILLNQIHDKATILEIESSKIYEIKVHDKSSQVTKEHINVLVKKLEKGKDLIDIYTYLLLDFLDYILCANTLLKQWNIKQSLALLRKPLKDNLLYMIWLLVEEDEFLEKFNNDIQELDLSGRLKRDKIKLIYDKLIEYDIDKGMLDLFYKTIYDASEQYSLELVWNKSLHLITTRKNSKTKNREMNFVFTSEELYNDYFEYIIQKLPPLLLFILEITEKFITNKSIKIFNEQEIFYNRFIEFIALAALSDNNWKSKIESYFQKFKESELEYIKNNKIEYINIKDDIDNMLNKELPKLFK